MTEYDATVELQFDVTVPVTADSEVAVEEIVDAMSLSEFLEWAGCASFTMRILEIKDE